MGNHNVRTEAYCGKGENHEKQTELENRRKLSRGRRSDAGGIDPPERPGGFCGI